MSASGNMLASVPRYLYYLYVFGTFVIPGKGPLESTTVSTSPALRSEHLGDALSIKLYFPRVRFNRQLLVTDRSCYTASTLPV
jgi:hypothetical protein